MKVEEYKEINNYYEKFYTYLVKYNSDNLKNIDKIIQKKINEIIDMYYKDNKEDYNIDSTFRKIFNRNSGYIEFKIEIRFKNK